MEKESLIIDLHSIKNEECLKFTFKGKFIEEDAEEGVNEWKEMFSSTDEEKIILIWDTLEMTGYESKARILWQKAIKKLKNQIDCVWLITNSKIIRSGAKLMSAFTSFPIKVVKSENSIAFK